MSKTLFRSVCASVLLMGAMVSAANAAGWTKFTNQNFGGSTGTMLQLTDGTIMVLADDLQTWAKLTPDATGSYAKGTWSYTAPMNTWRLYFASNVLPNGKVFVLGGEYSGAGGWTNTGEIYDPVADTWTPTPNFPKDNFGDDPTVLLPNGKVLCGFLSDGSTYLYDPKLNTFSPAGTKLRNDASDEETWVLLPDGSVLSYDIFASESSNPTKYTAQRYIPSTNTWVDAGTLPADLSGPEVGYELGPAMVLPDGRVIQVGGNENIALYDPKTNKWAAGPSLPKGMGADDAPGVILPNGHFLFLADFYLFNGPTHLFDFDYSTNKLTDITSTLPTELANDLADGPSFFRRMMIMPDGHLMLGTGETLWDYAPTGAPQSSWVPVIKSITKGTPNSVSAYQLTGNRLTGISQGASYGDDVESDTNYPLVRLTASNTVRFARTTNWTPGISKPGATTSSTVQFSVPVGLKPGNYKVAVIANGMASAETTVFLADTNNYVSAFFRKGALLLVDDPNDNSVVVTQQGTKLTIQGLAGTLIGDPDNNSATATFDIGQNGLAVFFDNTGNNTFSMTGVKVPWLDFWFGPGRDSTTLTYCTIGSMFFAGNTGTDILNVIATKVGGYSSNAHIKRH